MERDEERIGGWGSFYKKDDAGPSRHREYNNVNHWSLAAFTPAQSAAGWGSGARWLWKWAIDVLCHLWIHAADEELRIRHGAVVVPTAAWWPLSANGIPPYFARRLSLKLQIDRSSPPFFLLESSAFFCLAPGWEQTLLWPLWWPDIPALWHGWRWQSSRRAWRSACSPLSCRLETFVRIA